MSTTETPSKKQRTPRKAAKPAEGVAEAPLVPHETPQRPPIEPLTPAPKKAKKAAPPAEAPTEEKAPATAVPDSEQKQPEPQEPQPEEQGEIGEVLVAGLPDRYTEKGVRDLLHRLCGRRIRFIKLNLLMRKDADKTGRSRGICFATVSDIASALMLLDGRRVDKRHVLSASDASKRSEKPLSFPPGLAVHLNNVPRGLLHERLCDALRSALQRKGCPAAEEVIVPQGKGFALARFSSQEIAAQAVEVLHGAKICGCKVAAHIDTKHCEDKVGKPRHATRALREKTESAPAEVDDDGFEEAKQDEPEASGKKAQVAEEQVEADDDAEHKGEAEKDASAEEPKAVVDEKKKKSKKSKAAKEEAAEPKDEVNAEEPKEAQEAMAEEKNIKKRKASAEKGAPAAKKAKSRPVAK